MRNTSYENRAKRNYDKHRTTLESTDFQQPPFVRVCNNGCLPVSDAVCMFSVVARDRDSDSFRPMALTASRPSVQATNDSDISTFVASLSCIFFHTNNCLSPDWIDPSWYTFPSW